MTADWAVAMALMSPAYERVVVECLKSKCVPGLFINNNTTKDTIVNC